MKHRSVAILGQLELEEEKEEGGQDSHAICAGDCKRFNKSRDTHVKVRPLKWSKDREGSRKFDDDTRRMMSECEGVSIKV